METDYWQIPKKTAKRPLDNAPPSSVKSKNRFEGLASEEIKSGRVPPIIMSATGTHGTMTDTIKKFTKDFSIKYIGNNNVSIQCRNIGDFEKLRDGLRSPALGQNFHTFSRKEEKIIKSVVRGLPKLPECDIKEDLIAQGFPVAKVLTMKTKEPMSNSTELYLVFFEPTVNTKKIKEIRYICHTRVSISKYTNRSPNITQCFRCQDYGHAAKNCNRPAKCVKCTGSHLTADCSKKDRTTPATCVGCSGPHPANFKDCPKRQEYLKILEARKTRRPATNPWKTPEVVTKRSAPLINNITFPSLPIKTNPIPTIPKPTIPTKIPQPNPELTSIASLQKMIKILKEIRAKTSGCTDKLELALILVEYLDEFE
jgi:Associated with zinc fingers